jgi:ubiquinol-cytochrome c reductase cytochrome c1 subunit
MRRVIIAFALLVLPSLALAVTGGYPLDKAPIDLSNKASLQRGAKLFVNYCMGCHSAEYQRYNRLARDLSLTDEQVADNLIFTSDTKVGDTMEIAMPGEDAKQWFGAAPPDLSVIARSRGVDYLYTYLRTFYLDESRPWGVNNAVFPSVGMPHVLWELQGWQKPVYGTVHDASGEEKEIVTGVQLVEPGAMTQPEFDAAMADLVNFLAYIGEPAQLERKRIGWWVLGFLVLAFAVFYPLKKEYWKDVH